MNAQKIDCIYYTRFTIVYRKPLSRISLVPSSVKNSMTQSSAFIRTASGLVRDYGLFDAFLLGTYPTWGLLWGVLQFPWFWGFFPGSSIPLALILIAPPFILLGIVYWALGVAMPRSGADYMWVSRTFGPTLGFAWSMVWMVAYGISTYIYSTFAFESVISTSLSVPGLLFGVPSLVGLANFLQTTNAEFVVALVIIALYVIVTVLGGSVLKKVFYIGWIAEVVGIAVMWWLLATTSPTAFASLWNATPVGASLPYEKIIPLAVANGYTAVPRNSWDATVASLPLAGLFWFGFYYMTMVGGEIKEVRRTIPLSIIAVFLATFVWWAVSAELYLDAFGTQWSYALGYLWERTSAYTGPTPTLNLLLSITAYPNVLIMAIVAVTFIITSFLMTFMNFFLPTRYLFAWAFDRAIPTRFADVSERFRSPVKATLLLAAFTVFGVFIFLYTNFGTVFTMSVMMMTIAFFGPALAAIVFPYRQKALFETLPSALKARVGNIPVLSIIGVFVTIGVGYLGYAFFLSPQVMTASTFGFEFIIGTFIFGVLIYLLSRAYWKRKGVAIDLAFKQLPPE